MLLQYLEALRTIGASSSTKFVIPMELMSMMKDLTKTFGVHNPDTSASSAPSAPSSASEALPPELGNS